MYSRVYVEITNTCNKSCSFCHGTKREKRAMSLDEFKLVANKLVPFTKYIYYHVLGEPLSHPRLPEFIRYATDLGMKSAVTTNGTLLKKRGDELLDAGVYKVNISLHSFEGSDEKGHIKYLTEVLDFADKASSAGVLVILRLWNLGALDQKNAEVISLIKKRFGTDTWVDSPTGARIRHKLHLDYAKEFRWPDLNAEYCGEEVFCHGLGDHFSVLSNGVVVPCCLDADGVIELGNIFTDDLGEILSSKRATDMKEGFNRRFATEELCRRCGYATRFSLK